MGKMPKMILLVCSAALYCAVCTVLTAWLYRMGAVRDFRHWRSWGAASEMATIMTCLSAPWWIWPLFSKRSLALLSIGGGTAILSGISTGCYIALILLLGPDHPILTMFGSSASDLFREDVGIIFAVIIAPTMAILSGLVPCAMLMLVRGRKVRDVMVLRL